MKLHFAVLVAVGIVASASRADLLKDLGRKPGRSSTDSLVREATLVLKMEAAEVPVRTDCAPKFEPGDDGIFRRTDYCHKLNPPRPSGFLQLGYDVPAGFLKGFTEADVWDHWTNADFQVPAILGSKIETPKELFTQLNVNAAQAWEKLLACARGNADQARELYRTGAVGCDDEAGLRSRIADLRESLRALASSVEVSILFDVERLDRLHDELITQMQGSLRDAIKEKREANHAQIAQMRREIDEIWKVRFFATAEELQQLLRNYVPRMPRMHPLLTQLLVEEILTAIRPDESPSSLAGRIKSDRTKSDDLTQLLLWMVSIEDRECSTLGLWPSANRVAIQALGEKLDGVADFLGWSKRYIKGSLNLVYCPAGRSSRFERSKIRGPFSSWFDTSDVMLFSDVYTSGRHPVWRELREVRERYSRAHQ